MSDGPIELLTDDAAIVAAITGEAQLTIAEQDAETVAREIVARILSAETDDDLFGGKEAVHARDVLGIPIMIRGVKWYRSAYENGPTVFAVLDAVNVETGEAIPVTCGSRNVMAQVLKLSQLGKIPTPYAVTIEQAERPTAAGNYPLWLDRASG